MTQAGAQAAPPAGRDVALEPADEPQREPIYDEDGPSLGGFVWRDAQVQVEILRRDNAVSPWRTQGVASSTLATLTIAEDEVLY